MEYARLMGGGISVASEVGKGSTFRLEIPIEPAGAEAVPPKLLLADNDEGHRAWLGNLLRSAGFDVRESSNGPEAVTIGNEWHPDLLLKDIGDRMVIVALTANALDNSQPDFLTKPFQESDLFQKIASHLGTRFRYAEPGAATVSLTAGSLAELPPDLMVEMRQAILTGDMDRFTRVLPEVAERDMSVADGLRELADRYDYDALAELLK
jgi:chemotaxis family two-component system sensor kinase Cph1